jgi:hypothetical protein
MRSPLEWSLGLALVLAGCGEDNTTCTIGTLICTDSQGEIAQDGDAQLRRCSGPAEGGDEDGEFVVVEDCAAAGNACYVEFRPDHGDELGACITRACADDGLADCVELGSTRCMFGDELAVCGDAGDGCQRYSVDQACTDAGGMCEFDQAAGEPVCVVP